MQDRPTAKKRVEVVREFLKEEVLPDIEDSRIGYRMKVAMNGLGILERELAQEEKLLEEEHERLAHLLGEDRTTPGSLEEIKDRVGELNRELAGRIRSGEALNGTFEHLMQTVTGKLEVANPNYL
jgi:hypothetical protein